MKTFFIKIGKSEIRNIIAIICVTGVFALLFLLCFIEIPPVNKDLFERTIDRVITLGFGVMICWYFGSSKNEADANKNDITKVESETKLT